MNCKDYKEAIAADPSQLFDGTAHASACEPCAAFRDEILALDAKIAKALNIDASNLVMPELLPPGEEDTNIVSMPLSKQGRASTPIWMGLAASVVMAVVIGGRFLSPDVAYTSLASEIVAHMDHEPYALRVTDQAVPEQKLARVVRGHVAEMDIGVITYANSCVINGKTIPHLVIQGARGPITLLLLPDEMTDGAIELKGVGITGVILPVGDGSIAIIGERDEPLQELEQQLVDSVKWST